MDGFRAVRYTELKNEVELDDRSIRLDAVTITPSNSDTAPPRRLDSTDTAPPGNIDTITPSNIDTITPSNPIPPQPSDTITIPVTLTTSEAREIVNSVAAVEEIRAKMKQYFDGMLPKLFIYIVIIQFIWLMFMARYTNQQTLKHNEQILKKSLHWKTYYLCNLTSVETLDNHTVTYQIDTVNHNKFIVKNYCYADKCRYRDLSNRIYQMCFINAQVMEFDIKHNNTKLQCDHWYYANQTMYKFNNCYSDIAIQNLISSGDFVIILFGSVLMYTIYILVYLAILFTLDTHKKINLVHPIFVFIIIVLDIKAIVGMVNLHNYSGKY